MLTLSTPTIKKSSNGWGTFPIRSSLVVSCHLLVLRWLVYRARELFMNLAEAIAPHIPYLRRFARSLTGSQSSGDAYVAATLEALVADRGIFPEDVEPKVGLYKLFSSLWRSVDINLQDLPPPADRWEEQARRSLKSIAPLPRQAFLLLAVERLPSLAFTTSP